MEKAKVKEEIKEENPAPGQQVINLDEMAAFMGRQAWQIDQMARRIGQLEQALAQAEK